MCTMVCCMCTHTTPYFFNNMIPWAQQSELKWSSINRIKLHIWLFRIYEIKHQILWNKFGVSVDDIRFLDISMVMEDNSSPIEFHGIVNWTGLVIRIRYIPWAWQPCEHGLRRNGGGRSVLIAVSWLTEFHALCIGSCGRLRVKTDNLVHRLSIRMPKSLLSLTRWALG